MATAISPTTTARAWHPAATAVLLSTCFALLGLSIGAQGVLWAELMPALQVSTGAFGSAQFVAPLIAIALLLLGGQLSARVGKRRLGGASLVLLGGSSLALAGSAGLWGLVGALLLFGAGLGLFETAMNGAALDWERATGRAMINVMHAGYSAGAIAGALVAGVLLGAGRQPAEVLALLALVCGAVFLAMLPVRFPPEDDDAGGAAGPGATVRVLAGSRVMIVLALVCILGAAGESVANVWSVIYLRELGAGAFVGGATFALLSGGMLAGRLLNAVVVARLGTRVSLEASGGGMIAAAALLLLPGGIPAAILAFAVLGVAIAGVVPSVLSAAARLSPGNSGAVASAMLAALYVSFLVSPPLIGWLAELASLRMALLTVGVSGLGILWLTRRIDKRALDGDHHRG